MPHKLIVHLLIPVAGAVLVAAMVSGCAPAKVSPSAGHSHHPTGNSTIAAPPSDTPKPTPSWPPALPANALLQISATVTAPGGTSASLVQTVYVPAPITAAQRTQFNTDCAGENDPDATGAPWLNNYQSAWALTSTITATLNPGTTSWDNTANGVLADFMGFGDFTGAYTGFEAACAPGFISIPGTQQAIAPIQGTNPSGQDYGWAGEFAGYGFYGGGNDPDSPDLGGSAVVSHCSVQLSNTAASNATAAAWAARVSTLMDGCDYRGPQVP